jgi:hypothetical protein
MDAVAVSQLDCFAAGVLFARTEGIVPAPEPTHALAEIIRIVNECKETGESKVLLTALCGHGHFDLAACVHSFDHFKIFCAAIETVLCDASFSAGMTLILEAKWWTTRCPAIPSRQQWPLYRSSQKSLEKELKNQELRYMGIKVQLRRFLRPYSCLMS